MAKQGPPLEARGYRVSSIQSAFYAQGRGGKGPGKTLTHALWVDARGDAVDGRTICKRIWLSHLEGDDPEGLTCPVCLERVTKSGLPRKC